MALIPKYGAVTAKLRAMQNYVLTVDDYKNLCSYSDISSAINTLKENPPYKKIFEDLDFQNLHRGIIEEKLSFAYFDEFQRLYNFVSDSDDKKYLGVFFLYNEKEILKQLLTSISDKRPLIDNTGVNIDKMFGFLNNKIKIDKQKLKDAKTVTDFVDSILETDLTNYLRRDYEGTHGIFSIQTRFDIYYYTQIYKYQNKYLKGENKEIISKMNNMEMDLKNIMWIYRLKTSYASRVGNIYAYLIPYSYRLKREEISRMIDSNSEAELSKIIYETYYGKFFTPDIPIEKGFYIAMNNAYAQKRILNQNPDTLAPIAGFVYEKRMEVRNVISLLEGIRYGLEPTDVFNYLILPEKLR